MSRELEDDLRTTAATVKADAERLAHIEGEKERLPAGDPRALTLSREASDAAQRLAVETAIEEELVRAVTDGKDAQEPPA